MLGELYVILPKIDLKFLKLVLALKHHLKFRVLCEARVVTFDNMYFFWVNLSPLPPQPAGSLWVIQ